MFKITFIDKGTQCAVLLLITTIYGKNQKRFLAGVILFRIFVDRSKSPRAKLCLQKAERPFLPSYF